MFNQVQINVPLFDAIQQVPSYAKFLKDMCTKKKKKKYSQKDLPRIQHQWVVNRAHPCKIQRPRESNHLIHHRTDHNKPSTAWSGNKYQLAPLFCVSATRAGRPPSNSGYYIISWSFCKNLQVGNYRCPYMSRGVHLPRRFHHSGDITRANP